MDKGDFLLRDSGFHQLLFQVVINAERAVLFGGTEVTEHKLSTASLSGLLPNPDNVAGTGGNLSIGIIHCQRIDEPHIQCQLSAIVGDTQHIVRLRVYTTCANVLGPFCKPSHHLLLKLGWLNHFSIKVRFWNWQLQHIRSLNICHLLECSHQFRQIKELGKPCFCPIAAALRRKLNGCDGFAKVAGPIIKMNQTHFLQGVVLQIPLNRIKFHHAVADGCTSSKNNTPSSSDLVQVPALHEKVGRLLRFGLGNTAHIPHLSRQKEVLKIMALIHEYPVNTQFFKRHKVVLTALVIESFQPCL